MSTRRAAVLVVPAVVTAGLLVVGSGAAAAADEDAIPRDSGLTTGEYLLWLVGLPLLVVAVIVVVVSALTSLSGRRRPTQGVSWWAAPLWINGPDDPARAVAEAAPRPGGGGARARW